MKKIKRWLLLVLGCLIVGITINLFFKDVNFVPGSIFGFSLLFSSVTSMNLSLVILLSNILFIALGWLFTSIKRLKKVILPSLLIPLFTFASTNIGALINIKDADPFLIAIYGGVLMGLGFRFIYQENMYACGLELIKTKKKYGRILPYILDGLWVILSAVIFDINAALYSVISIIIMEILSHRANLGVSESKVFYIITKKEEDVRKYIIDELGYDLTIFDVKGGFTNNKNRVIMTVIPTKKYYELKEGIKLIDPKAFISITDSYEVINAHMTTEKKENLI